MLIIWSTDRLFKREESFFLRSNTCLEIYSRDQPSTHGPGDHISSVFPLSAQAIQARSIASYRAGLNKTRSWISGQDVSSIQASGRYFEAAPALSSRWLKIQYLLWRLRSTKSIAMLSPCERHSIWALPCSPTLAASFNTCRFRLSAMRNPQTTLYPS